MNKIKLGDFVINFDEVLWIKKVGNGARVKFKSNVTLDRELRRVDLLEIAVVSDDDWYELEKVEEK